MNLTTDEALDEADDALKLDPIQRVEAIEANNEITAILHDFLYAVGTQAGQE